MVLLKAAVYIALVALASSQMAMDNVTSSLKLRINERGIDLLKDIALERVEEQSISYGIGSIFQSDVFGSLFTREASLNEIFLETLSFEAADLSALPSNILFLNASRLSGTVIGEYTITVKFADFVNSLNRGMFRASFEGALFVSIGLDGNENNLFSGITTGRCQPLISNVNIEITSVQEGRSNLDLQAIVAKELASQLTTELCGGLAPSLVEQFNQFITGLSAQVNVSSGVLLDLSLTRPPVSGNEYFESEFDGKCYPIGNPDIELPYERQEIPDATPSTLMAQIVIGRYVIETCLYSLFSQGFFNIELDLDMSITSCPLPNGKRWMYSFPSVPHKDRFFPTVFTIPFPVTLDTTFLNNLVPGIISLGAARPIRIQTIATMPPAISLKNSVISLNGAFDIVISVIQEDRTSARAFTLLSNIKADGRFFASGSTLMATIDDISFDLSLKNSNIGEISVAAISFFISGSLPQAILPAVNAMLINGFSVPSAFGITLINAESMFSDDYIEIRGDIARATTGV